MESWGAMAPATTSSPSTGARGRARATASPSTSTSRAAARPDGRSSATPTSRTRSRHSNELGGMYYRGSNSNAGRVDEFLKQFKNRKSRCSTWRGSRDACREARRGPGQRRGLRRAPDFPAQGYRRGERRGVPDCAARARLDRRRHLRDHLQQRRERARGLRDLRRALAGEEQDRHRGLRPGVLGGRRNLSGR
jgi:hypothetical protein